MKIKKVLLNILLIFVLFFSAAQLNQAQAAYGCGSTFTQTFRKHILWMVSTWVPTEPRPDCNCYFQEIGEEKWTEGWWRYKKITFCCGYYYENKCLATPQSGPAEENIVAVVDKETLNSLNPLKLFSTKADQFSTPGGIISEVLKYAFPIAGTILFLMLIFAGVKMLTGATNSKNMDEGKQIIGTAIAGFIILFASYWIIQLIEVIFGIKILGI